LSICPDIINQYVPVIQTDLFIWTGWATRGNICKY